MSQCPESRLAVMSLSLFLSPSPSVAVGMKLLYSQQLGKSVRRVFLNKKNYDVLNHKGFSSVKEELHRHVKLHVLDTSGNYWLLIADYDAMLEVGNSWLFQSTSVNFLLCWSSTA